MNNKRRDSLRSTTVLLDNVSAAISRVLDEEQDSIDNIPENLQYSENYERMEAAIEKLEEVIDKIDEIKELIQEAAE